MLSEIRLSTLCLFCVSVSLSGLAYGQNNSDQNEETAMERVTGIGGLFIVRMIRVSWPNGMRSIWV